MTRKISLEKDLLTILLTDSFDSFTILELRGAYLAKVGDPGLDKIEARRYVYRHILRLEKKGLLMRKRSAKSGRTYYSKTSDFSAKRFKTHITSRPRETRSKPANLNGVKQQLREKLNRYRSELLISIGETEEYKSLHEDFPDLINELQEQYNSARDKCSKIHGRIKAIETLIKNSVLTDTDNAIA